MAESQFGINLLVALPCTVAKKLLVEKWESGIIYLGMWITIHSKYDPKFPRDRTPESTPYGVGHAAFCMREPIHGIAHSDTKARP